MGDKTQLIAFSLATRYRRPWAVMLGILLGDCRSCSKLVAPRTMLGL